jgi:hypothetical protein
LGNSDDGLLDDERVVLLVGGLEGVGVEDDFVPPVTRRVREAWDSGAFGGEAFGGDGILADGQIPVSVLSTSDGLPVAWPGVEISATPGPRSKLPSSGRIFSVGRSTNVVG